MVGDLQVHEGKDRSHIIPVKGDGKIQAQLINPGRNGKFGLVIYVDGVLTLERGLSHCYLDRKYCR
jgi:hypothetical protein